MASSPHRLRSWPSRRGYATYRSPFGPEYKTRPNFHGVGLGTLGRYGFMAAGFGVSAGIFALFFFSDIPKVRRDVIKRLPFVGEMEYFQRDVAPEDNPF